MLIFLGLFFHEFSKSNISFSIPSFSSIQMGKALTYSYLLELDIPKIQFKDYVYPMDSPFNKVDLHVEILESSNIENNLYFLAGHSGNGRYSYFNHLVDLEKGDVVILHIQGKRLCYVVCDIYLIDKDGYMTVMEEEDVLYLITCSLLDKGQQLIVKCYLT